MSTRGCRHFPAIIHKEAYGPQGSNRKNYERKRNIREDWISNEAERYIGFYEQ